MPQAIQLEVEVPEDLARFRLPAGVQHRQIAYVRFDDKLQGCQVTHLYVMNRDGSQTTMSVLLLGVRPLARWNPSSPAPNLPPLILP